MSFIKDEEYTALGDFVKASFERDQDVILRRYPKMNAAFHGLFSAKLESVKVMESGYKWLQQQKAATTQLYAEAHLLEDELDFVIDYMEDAGLDTNLVAALRKDLVNDNIEGAVLKIEDVAQYIEGHAEALIEEGMAADFVATLRTHKVSLAAKNGLQNQMMNTRKGVTENHDKEYAELFGYIRKITNAGKKVFRGTAKMDDYVVDRNIKRMRAAKRHEDGEPA